MKYRFWSPNTVGIWLALSIPPSALAQTGEPWWPVSGTVVLSGGGLNATIADSLVDRLITLAGGPDALIVIIPTAHDGLPARLPSSAPEPTHIKNIRAILAARGARNVVFLHTRDRKVANSEEFAAVLRSANAVFLTGGAFGVLDKTYHGTLVERQLKALLARGGVLVGDSAGAIALGCFSLNWNVRLKSLAKATDGLCVLPRVTVTPHVRDIQGDEQTADVAAYITAHPRTVGINLSDNTLLVIHREMVEVVGTGAATVFDPTVDGRKPYIRLSGGQHGNLTRATTPHDR